MHCFVINLEKDDVRRAQITAQLNEAGQAFEIFPGVYGKDLSDEELRRSYDAQAAACGRREMTLGEIGCALSHLGVYRAILERNLPFALVLEDDVKLGPDFARVLPQLEACLRVDTPQVILLNWVKLTSYVSTRRLSERHVLAPVLNETWGAYSYVLNRAAARSLLAALYPVRLPADIWDQFRREGLASVRAVVPYCTGISELNEQSNLDVRGFAAEAEAKRRAESGWVNLLRRYLYRKFLYQLFVRPFLRKQARTW
ncbi:glycosyltransferase family 25 protein [Sphaerotilaceae bacterium SBD11-9]